MGGLDRDGPGHPHIQVWFGSELHGSGSALGWDQNECDEAAGCKGGEGREVRSLKQFNKKAVWLDRTKFCETRIEAS